MQGEPIHLDDALAELFTKFDSSASAIRKYVSGMQQHIVAEVMLYEGLVANLHEGRAVSSFRNGIITYEKISDQPLPSLQYVLPWGEILSQRNVMLFEMAFIYLLAAFDAYVADVFGAAMRSRPETLKSSQKQLTYQIIVEQHERGALLDYMVQRELHELSYKSIGDQAEYFKKKFKIDLQDSGVSVETLTELRACRNALVHNAGVVNYLYLDAVRASEYRLGERVKVSEHYWSAAFGSIYRVAEFLLDALVAKFCKRPRDKQQELHF